MSRFLDPQTFANGDARRRFLRNSLTGLAAWQLLKHQAIAIAAERTGLGQAFKSAFHIGAAVSSQSLDQPVKPELDLLAREFTSITPENCMKWENIRPNDKWHWDTADKFVQFGQANNMYMAGHTLVWHSQIPRTAFQDAKGAPLTRIALLARMEEHIATLAGRYKGKLHSWDVVNEALDEGRGWRKSEWFNIIGPDFMEHAFRFAHQADPNARLLYNDYNMHNPQKREFLVGVLRDYLKRGVPIHGVGLQEHSGLTYPDPTEAERTVAAYAGLGLEVHVTELDFDVLPARSTSADVSTREAGSADLNPYTKGLPEDIAAKQAERYEWMFRLLLKYKSNVKRVTTWGLHDGISWKNDFPIEGRTNYPLLFDRKLQPKPAYQRVMKLATEL